MLELSEEQLNNLNKDALVIIAASLQNRLRSMAQQLENANARLDDNNRQIELLTEQIRIMNQRHFGKKAESGLSDMEGQLTLFDSFNEAEGFQKNDFLMATRNFRWKSTSVCISFRKPLLLMSITFMSTHPKTMMAPSSGLSVP